MVRRGVIEPKDIWENGSQIDLLDLSKWPKTEPREGETPCWVGETKIENSLLQVYLFLDGTCSCTQTVDGQNLTYSSLDFDCREHCRTYGQLSAEVIGPLC